MIDRLPNCYRCGNQPCTCADGLTIYNADCLLVLPLMSPDAVVTDPVWPNATVPLAGSDDPYGILASMCEHLPETTKRIAVQLGCDSDPRFLSSVPSQWPFFRASWLEYVRPHYKGRLLYTSDVAYLFGEPPKSAPGKHVIPGRHLPTSTNGYKSDHPCPRKPQHVRWLVNWWTEETDVVVDPFAGSGTTGEACKQLGRKCVLIEVEERYCEIAARRLEQGVLF